MSKKPKSEQPMSDWKKVEYQDHYEMEWNGRQYIADKGLLDDMERMDATIPKLGETPRNGRKN